MSLPPKARVSIKNYLADYLTQLFRTQVLDIVIKLPCRLLMQTILVRSFRSLCLLTDTTSMSTESHVDIDLAVGCRSLIRPRRWQRRHEAAPMQQKPASVKQKLETLWIWLFSVEVCCIGFLSQASAMLQI